MIMLTIWEFFIWNMSSLSLLNSFPLESLVSEWFFLVNITIVIISNLKYIEYIIVIPKDQRSKIINSFMVTSNTFSIVQAKSSLSSGDLSVSLLFVLSLFSKQTWSSTVECWFLLISFFCTFCSTADLQRFRTN